MYNAFCVTLSPYLSPSGLKHSFPCLLWELADSSQMSVSLRIALPQLKKEPCPRSCPSPWGQTLLTTGQCWGGREDNTDQTPLLQGRAPPKGHLCPDLPIGAFVATAPLTPLSYLPQKETNAEPPIPHQSSRKPTSHSMANCTGRGND